MEGLLSLLLFAAVFFVMMRYGCGAHIMHAGHGKHSHGPGANKDPVCSMQVTPDRGYSKVHNGAMFRFCSRSCLDKFERRPDRYLPQTNKFKLTIIRACLFSAPALQAADEDDHAAHQRTGKKRVSTVC